MQVRLDLLVGDYVRNAEQASRATASIGDAAEKPRSALDRLKTVGVDLGRTMVAAAGVGAAALAGWTASAVTAGVAYNSLQQTAGSALETLMGSAEAASAQMERLSAFARTSPFPRQLWIQAQQTLIGFGVEAERIVPIFEALQDGVVAVGGSAQQIEEVVQILAQITTTGRVTADELNELAYRGINAAELVGDAWGMSAAQLRDSVSAGTVDATSFIDALVDQMSTRYGGAAEDLRSTWVGALDRIAGATRDIGSVIAEPFIDPQGGGAAVQWANDVADALRAFEAALRPAVEVLSQRAEPAFQAASAAMQRFAEAIGEVDLVAVLDRLSAGAPILTAFGAAAAAAGSASALSAIGMGSLAATINPVAAGILGLAAASPVFRDALVAMMSAVAPLIPVLADLGIQIAEGLTMAISALMPFVELAVDLVAGMVQVFTALPEPIQTAAIAVGAFALALRRLGPVGTIFAGIAYIATAVSSITDSSAEAVISVNDLADDLRDLQDLGQTFRITEANMRPILEVTDALSEGIQNLESRAGASFAAAAEGAREFLRVQEDGVYLAREWVDEQGRANAIGTQLVAGSNEFAEAVGTLDDAMASLVLEGENAEEVLASVAEMYNLSEDELAALVPLLDDYNAEAERQAEVNAQAADEQAAFAEKVGESVAALQELADEMRAQVDPVFAAIRALNAYEDAQDAYNEAVAEHGAASQEALDAEMALIEAYLDAAAAAGAMAQATGGELPPELIAAAEAANISEEGMRLLEEQFYETRDAGEQFGEDLAGVNSDLSTETGRMAAQTGLELAGMEGDWAGFVVTAKSMLDDLMASGYSYEEALAEVAQRTNKSQSLIESGFEDARDAGLEFSDEYPAHISLTGVDEVLNAADVVQRRLDAVTRTVNISFQYENFVPRGGGRIPVSAEGRIARSPMLTWVAEAGHPESIISWDPQYRERSLAIWEETGRQLGAFSAATGAARPAMTSSGGGRSGPDHFMASAVIDLGEGVQQVVDIKFERHDRDLKRRATMGTGAYR
jgi:tape measure domain-containing protein